MPVYRARLPALLLLLLSLASAGCTTPATTAAAASGPVADAQRGRLLYGTHCLECHTTQAHWRDKRIVQSWPGLLAQVTRWQRNSGLAWSESEIQDVAAYLNGMFYKLDCPMHGCQGTPARAGL